MKKTSIIKAAIALALATPLLASAESELTIGSGPAAAKLDFRVIIPRVLFLAVGTGATGLADDTTVDTVTFDFGGNPGDIGSGAAASLITGAVVDVKVLGNNGAITLTSTNTGPLTNAAGDTIAWTEITAVSSDAANFASPAPSGAAVVLPTSSGKLTNRTANWTFSYANSAMVPPGTYGTTNGRVTYTATML